MGEILLLDKLTAGIAHESLAARGNDLSIFAQSLHEEWTRFRIEKPHKTGHLFSTTTNIQDSKIDGRTYHRTSLIQPGEIQAEDRPISERFLRGKPSLYGELSRIYSQDRMACGFCLKTTFIRIGKIGIGFDEKASIASFYVPDIELPNVAITNAIGRPVGELIEMPFPADDEILDIRQGDEKTMVSLLGSLCKGLIVDIKRPEMERVSYIPHYERPYPGALI